MNIDNLKIEPFDERRDLLIPGDETATLDLCVRHFVSTAREAIQNHGSFFVALSGGSTPKKIYQAVTASPYKEQIDWNKVYLFWGDERSVPPEDPESNFKMAMDAGFSSVPIPKDQIHRMVAEENIEENALSYEKTIQNTLQGRPFDLVILGMGEDGHTASLFPQTEGLKAENRLSIANYVPQKNTWRMTLTYDALNSALNTAIYVIGDSKKNTLAEIFSSELRPERYPIQLIGTKESKALWIVDEAAATLLNK
ncbi:MAG: 6-phosphogluconolactonase [Simkaniaceae bacterium]|nr:6-phosphogluconolactonase [Candidatus Sacchlamyda saccharinae]